MITLTDAQIEYATGALAGLFLWAWLLTAWRLRRVRRAKRGERTAPAGLAANALELTATERDRLNREFFWTIRGVRR